MLGSIAAVGEFALWQLLCAASRLLSIRSLYSSLLFGGCVWAWMMLDSMAATTETDVRLRHHSDDVLGASVAPSLYQASSAIGSSPVLSAMRLNQTRTEESVILALC